MERALELELMDEMIALKEAGSAFLRDAVSRNPGAHYSDPDRFDRELKTLFRHTPNAVAHISELSGANNFIRADVGGLPALVTRGKDGACRAFVNACRHRGTRLVDDMSGCQKRFSCPYHAWTYANDGRLLAAPHFDEGFGELQKEDLGLIPLRCEERFGFVWVWADGDGAPIDLDHWFDDLDAEMNALGFADMRMAADDTQRRKANWKILVEGGIEAYHFKVAHRTTIGPHFEDNLSGYRLYGPHMRSVLPRITLSSVKEHPVAERRLRDHANVLYTLFPGNQWLAMQDHVVWIRAIPLSPSETHMRLVTLVPTTGPDADKTDAHWQRNHAITLTTLNEDFVIGESIQDSVNAGVVTEMLFGRFEGALAAFNQMVEQYI